MYTIKVKGPTSTASFEISPSSPFSELHSKIQSSFPQFQTIEFDILQGFPPAPMTLADSDPISNVIKGNDNLRVQAKSQAGKIIQATGPSTFVSKKVPRALESMLPRSILSKRQGLSSSSSSSSFSTSSISSTAATGGSIASTFFYSLLGGGPTPSTAPPAPAPTTSRGNSGPKTVPLVDAVGGIKVVAFYFSAHWCPPCRQFTPRLASQYNSWKSQNLPIEVIFCSSDRTESDFNQYYSEMPWAAIPFGSSQIQTLGSTYQVNGIPRLVVINAENGSIIENNAVSSSLDAASWCRSVK